MARSARTLAHSHGARSARRLTIVGGVSKGTALRLLHLRALSLLYHTLPAAAAHFLGVVRLVESGRLGLHPAVTLPLLAMCAVSMPVAEGLLSSDLRARLASSLSNYQPIRDLTIRPMRRRPGSRHVFSCKLVVANQRTGRPSVIELVGKRDTTRAAGKAAKEYEALKILWDAGFGQQAGLRIPQPLLHFEDLQVIIQEKARGVKFRAVLGEGSDASFDQARMVGMWLAKMHGLPVPCPRICAYVNEKAALRKFVEAISITLPYLQPELQFYREKMEELFDSFRDVPATLVHGDFHPDHVFVERDNVTVIDFERFAIGDSACDLGSFVAHMRTTACFSEKSMEAVDQEINIFLRSYYSNVSLRHGISISSRLTPFVLLACLEALYYVACVLKVTQPARLATYVNCLRHAARPLLESQEREAPAARSAAAGSGLSGGIHG